MTISFNCITLSHIALNYYNEKNFAETEIGIQNKGSPLKIESMFNVGYSAFSIDTNIGKGYSS